MKSKAYGRQASEDSLPIPESVAKKYHKYIMDVDSAGVEDGKLYYSCRGIAFRDAGSEMAMHSYCGSVSGFKGALRDSEECHCDTCERELWGAR